MSRHALVGINVLARSSFWDPPLGVDSDIHFHIHPQILV